MNGLLVIDKPAGMTSRDVVNRVQKWFPRKTKIGHTGTLDPLATGVLVVCVGVATRLADYVQAMGKCYASRFRLGATSSTDDADGDVMETLEVTTPTREQVETALKSFVGTVDQVPPAFSALKLAGQRAHDLARQGRDVQLAARPVRINAIHLESYDWPFLDVSVECGKGTYIRSIARDLGTKLGCGGLVQTLRRTRVGLFTVEKAITLDAQPAEVAVAMLPLSAAVASMEQIQLTQEESRAYRNGQSPRIRPTSKGTLPIEATQVALMDERGELLGVGVIELERIKPSVVFAERH